MGAAIIRYNERVARGHYLMGIETGSTRVEPGQFVMLKIVPGSEPLLRRPFSVYGMAGERRASKWARSGTVMELLYKVVGQGTGIMKSLKPGAEVDVMGPLGNAFRRPKASGRLVMVAGGIGIAPFNLIAGKVSNAVLLYGARGKSEAGMARPLKRAGLKVHFATDDGSVGRKGLVTELLAEELRDGDVIYACGPGAMLKATAAIAAERGVECHVSLERAMACGVGACLGCAVRTCTCGCKEGGGKDSGLKMVCSDGPVFDAKTIDWDSF